MHSKAPSGSGCIYSYSSKPHILQLHIVQKPPPPYYLNFLCLLAGNARAGPVLSGLSHLSCCLL